MGALGINGDKHYWMNGGIALAIGLIISSLIFGWFYSSSKKGDEAVTVKHTKGEFSPLIGPGDAIYIPYMWWHHVEGLDPFNVLVNYWWRDAPAWMDTPMNTLMYAIMTMRDLPPAQRAIWQEVFRHYVFEPGEVTADHIPPHARGVLAPLDEARARDLRARLLQRINR